MEGILIVAHGSKFEISKKLFYKIVDEFKDRNSDYRVEGSFMEFASPSIEDGIEALYTDGVRRVKLLPYLLFPGKHTIDTIPGEVDKIRDKYGNMEIEVLEPIGYDSRMIDILEDRVYRVD